MQTQLLEDKELKTIEKQDFNKGKSNKEALEQESTEQGKNDTCYLKKARAALAAQWERIHLPIPGDTSSIPGLGWRTPGTRQLRPYATTPGAHVPQRLCTLEPVPVTRKPPQRDAYALQLEQPPPSAAREEPTVATKPQGSQKQWERKKMITHYTNILRAIRCIDVKLSKVTQNFLNAHTSKNTRQSLFNEDIFKKVIFEQI